MRKAYQCGLVFLAAIALVGCAQRGAVDRARRNSSAAAVVTMNGWSFEPAHVSVKVGQTVQWANTDAVMKHTVTADPSLARTHGSVILPPGAAPFNSGMLDPGHTYQYTFTVPGLYRYFCIPHERFGMVGEVDVRP